MLKIIRKDHVLLLQSNIITQHPRLNELLEDNKRITEELVATLDQELQILINNMMPSIINSASKEWTPDDLKPAEILGRDKTTWKRCSLCNRKLREVYYIKNIINGKDLIVGKRCVQHFGFFGKGRFKTAKDLTKFARQTTFWLKLEKQFPGIETILFKWDNKLNEYPLLIPASMETEYINIGKRAKKLFDDYVNEKIDEEVYIKFEKIIESRDTILKKIEQFIVDNKSDKFMATKTVQDWLLRRNEYETYELLKKDGKITVLTLHRLNETEFMKKIIPEVNFFLKKINSEVLKVENGRYVISFFDNPEIKYHCKHQDLLFDYGYYIFDKDPIKPINTKDIIEKCIIKDTNSYEIILDYIISAARKSNLRIHRSDFFRDDIIFRYQINDKVTKKDATYYQISGLSKFINKYRGLPFKLVDPQEVANEITSRSKLSYEDIKSLLNFRGFKEEENLSTVS